MTLPFRISTPSTTSAHVRSVAPSRKCRCAVSAAARLAARQRNAALELALAIENNRSLDGARWSLDSRMRLGDYAEMAAWASDLLDEIIRDHDDR